MYGKYIVIKYNMNNNQIAFQRFDCMYCRNAMKCKTLENCTIRSYISQREDNTISALDEKSLNITLNVNNVEELKHAYQTVKRVLRLRAIPQPKAR